MNPITYVTADDPPFLIVHGDQDRTVPFNQSQLLFDALKQRSFSVHLHTIRGAGHGGPGFESQELLSIVGGFFDAQLKAAAAPVAPAAVTTQSDVEP